MINRRNFLTSAATAALAVTSAPLLAGTARAESVDMLRLMAPGALPDLVMGDPKAPVTIVEYASMTCPHCARFSGTTFPELKTKYIDTGKVKYIFREFPLDNLAAGASVLARCDATGLDPEGKVDPAGVQKFYTMNSLLFSQLTNWAVAEDPVKALLDLAKQTGMTEDHFYACLKDQKMLDDIIADRATAAKEFGVHATPTFFINGEKAEGEMSLEEVSKIIDSKLAS